VTPPHVPGPVRPITRKQFELLRGLVHRESGIFLSDAKRSLLVGRLLKRLRERGLDSFEAYYQVVESDPAERTRMLDCICTNETHFFREPRQFEFLERTACPQWERAAARGQRTRSLRVWSAGCSTGEEPYSLAMCLLARLASAQAWELDILGTDLSTHALARARAAVWPIEKATEIPGPLLKRFMLRGTGARTGLMKAGPELRGVVRLQRLNLNERPYEIGGTFDLILCRNVLIYFDRPSKEQVIARLVDRLAPGGYLMLGHAESLMGATSRTRSVGPAVYANVPAARAGSSEAARQARAC
jgi:chemotaxis protein methyltransferase CheR